MDKLRDDLNDVVSRMAPGIDTTEMVSYMIWGAAITTTRAFEGATLKIDPNTNRVFVSIRLRWWAKFGKFKPLRDAWLARAERRCKEHTPEGWRVLVYYEGGDPSQQKEKKK